MYAKDGSVKCKPLDLKSSQEVGNTFVLPWLDMMEAYLYVAAGNSPMNVMGCSVQNQSQNHID